MYLHVHVCVILYNDLSVAFIEYKATHYIVHLSIQCVVHIYLDGLIV